jgi:hypothetical protein
MTLTADEIKRLLGLTGTRRAGSWRRPQLLIPGGTFHMSRRPPAPAGAVLASTEWPGVEPPDVEQGDAAALSRSHPAMKDQIAAFAGR